MNPMRHGARILQGTLMGKELSRVEDDYGVIVVTQRGNKRVLNFGSMLEQSCVLVDKPYYLMHEYTQAMLLGVLFVDARHATLMGLGGGGFAHCLNHYFPDLIIQVVELRQAVIDIAYEWFNLLYLSRLKITCSDASDYLALAGEGSTDIIFSDLYLSEGMAECQAQQQYIQNAYKALTQQGWLILNFHDMPADDSPVMQTIRNLFAEIYLCTVPDGNCILYCGKAPLSFDEEQMQQRAESLVQQVDMPLMYYFRKLSKLGV